MNLPDNWSMVAVIERRESLCLETLQILSGNFRKHFPLIQQLSPLSIIPECWACRKEFFDWNDSRLDSTLSVNIAPPVSHPSDEIEVLSARFQEVEITEIGSDVLTTGKGRARGRILSVYTLAAQNIGRGRAQGRIPSVYRSRPQNIGAGRGEFFRKLHADVDRISMTVEQLSSRPNYIEQFLMGGSTTPSSTFEQMLPKRWTGYEIGEEIEIARVIYGQVGDAKVTIIIDRKADRNLVGDGLIRKKQYTQLISDLPIQVLLPWRGLGTTPYLFDRITTVDVCINKVGKFKVDCGTCQPLHDGLLLGRPFVLENKVNYSQKDSV